MKGVGVILENKYTLNFLLTKTDAASCANLEVDRNDTDQIDGSKQ